MFNVVQIKTLLIETEREIIIVIFHETTALFPVSFNTSSAVAEDKTGVCRIRCVVTLATLVPASCHVMS